MTITEAWKMIQEYMPLLAVAAAVALLFLGTKFVKHDRCDEHRQAIRTDLEENATARQELEMAVRELATKKDLEGMRKTLATLTTQVSVLQESMNGQKALFTRLEGQVDRIDNFLKRMPG